MATDICTRRLTKELKALQKDPIREPRTTVVPNESNILEMHYVMEGCQGTPYEGGVYHGKLIFPKEYPLRPPGVMMLTPNGRFQPGRRLCLSMSDFHPESWNPMWSVATILTGLYSFMMETAPTLGSIDTSTRKKRQLAAASLEWNVKNGGDRKTLFCKLFPEYVERFEQEQEKKKEAARNSQPALSTTVSSDRVVPVRPPRLPQGLYATLAGLIAILSLVLAVRGFL